MKKLSEESWEDIYTIYFETFTTPTTLVKEGIYPATHYVLKYLNPSDIQMNTTNSDE